MKIGSVLERNFTWSFEKFSALAEVGNPIGQQVCVESLCVCVYKYVLYEMWSYCICIV